MNEELQEWEIQMKTKTLTWQKGKNFSCFVSNLSNLNITLPTFMTFFGIIGYFFAKSYGSGFTVVILAQNRWESQNQN